MQFCLVHSPLVGPATWRWVAGALASAGHDVAVPDLRPAAVTGHSDELIAAAVSEVPPSWSSVVLVGHSGAGSILPSVAERLAGLGSPLVFVDAGLPPCEGHGTPSADFLGQLGRLALDGLLPKWSTWWGEEVMEMLVPSADRRVELETEMAEIPLAFFESPIAVPEGWCETSGCFLLLSEPYRDDAERARMLGWPVTERLGGHLDLVNHPEDIARAILKLVG